MHDAFKGISFKIISENIWEPLAVTGNARIYPQLELEENIGPGQLLLKPAIFKSRGTQALILLASFITLVIWGTSRRCSTGVESAMRRPLTPMSVCVLLLMCWTITSPPALALARQRSKSRLALWIDEHQMKALIGLDMEIPIIANGEVNVYLNKPELFDQIVIPPHIDTVNLTWQAGGDSYTYLFDNFTSLDQHLLYQPLLGIPARGYIPKFPTVFQITIPCKGKQRGVASLLLGLKIYDHWRRPLKGTPIQFTLKKQCVAFGGTANMKYPKIATQVMDRWERHKNFAVTSSLCKQDCRNGGTCNPHGVCECPQGFKGTLCDIALCNPACQNNGTCISPATCACPAGFHGNYCEKGRSLSTKAPASMCGRVCQNGGQCLPEGFCWCSMGFFGDACEYSRCNPMCMNGGTCTGTNQCQCTAQYSGPLCEIKDDTDRPRRSKEPDRRKPKKKKKKKRRKGKRTLDSKLRKAEARLLKITFRRSRKYDILKAERTALRDLKKKTEKEALSLKERRYLIKLLTRERKYLNSKDKTKLKRFKNLIRKAKRRQKKPRKRRLYVK